MDQFGQGEIMFRGGQGGIFGVDIYQAHGGYGDLFGGGKGSIRQSLERAGGRSGGGPNKRMESFPPQPGFLEMKTPAVWYHKQKDRPGERMVRNSPQ